MKETSNQVRQCLVEN